MMGMPSCRDMTRLLTAEGEAGWGTCALMALHLAMCEHCSRLARQLRLISRSLREAWSPRAAAPEGTEDLRRRVIERLRRS
ncbi:MAG: anti-sigma factor [Elusimicrobia bacterium]|nr:anti-sigma factor [Elusimicrobiota bacterium]